MDEANNESQATLETLNEKLNHIETKLDGINSRISNPKLFVVSIFMALGFVLFSTSLSLQFQIESYPESVLRTTHNSYMLAGIFLLAFGMWFALRKGEK